MDCSPPGSSVNGISQARILDWVDIFFFRESSSPRNCTWGSNITGRLCLLSYQEILSMLLRNFLSKWSCSVVSDSCEPMDYSLPDSSIHGIFQARVLKCVVISFSRACSWPRDWTPVSHIASRWFTIWATSDDTPKNVTKDQVAVISGIEFSHGLLGRKK